jgi:pyrroline-5-carboxylate reductase
MADGDLARILQEALEIQRKANVSWAAGKKDLFDDGNLTLTVLGCGNMGIAILGGIMAALNNSTPSDNENTPSKLPTKFNACVQSSKSAERVERELEKYNAKLRLFTNDNVRAVQQADVVILGCMPEKHREVLCAEGMKEALAGKLLVSILAGVKEKQIHDALYQEASQDTDKCRIVLAMPNTAAAVRQSMTVIAIPEPPLPADSQALLHWTFTRIGRVAYLPASNMSVATALCGSGIAFTMLMAESMAAGAIAMGCPTKAAYEMAAQTMRGAAELLSQGGHPAVLRDNASTPGGCTVAGLLKLEEGSFRGTVASAVKEATTVAGQLGQDE